MKKKKLTDRSLHSDIGRCVFSAGEMRKASHAGSEKKEKGEAVAQRRKENVDKDRRGKYRTKMSRGKMGEREGGRQTLTKAS